METGPPQPGAGARPLAGIAPGIAQPELLVTRLRARGSFVAHLADDTMSLTIHTRLLERAASADISSPACLRIFCDLPSPTERSFSADKSKAPSTRYLSLSVTKQSSGTCAGQKGEGRRFKRDTCRIPRSAGTGR